MKEFRPVVAALAIVFAVGCASTDKWQAEEIPVPRTTPFDVNEFARTAYLDGFRTGYRSENGGGATTVEMLTQPYSQARRMGFYAGQSAARAQAAGTAKK